MGKFELRVVFEKEEVEVRKMIIIDLRIIHYMLGSLF